MSCLALDELAPPGLAGLGQVDGAVWDEENVAVMLLPHLLDDRQVLHGDGDDLLDAILPRMGHTVVVVGDSLRSEVDGGRLVP
jgi:hypothetical protein